MAKIQSVSRKLLVILLAVFLHNSSFAQAKEQTNVNSISMEPFGDSKRHWYGIRDDGNIINPKVNQPTYKETEITKIADNILIFQRNNGGWPKNYDMQAILTSGQVDRLVKTKNKLHTTFDNSTTYTHIDYLAQVYTLTKIEKYKEACLKGIRFVLSAQYPNGGWPQYFPLEDNYSRRITFNDGAYVGIMVMLKKIVDNNPNFSFIGNDIRGNVKLAFEKGLECIIKTQITDKGKLTAWCQQYDEINLSPAWARAFEPPSICNGESVSIVLFLMSINHPNQRIIEAVRGAVNWFNDSKIAHTRVKTIPAPAEKSKWKITTTDVVVVADSLAPPIWARYYELGTEKPLFCDRNGKFLYSLAEVSRERRSGYGWYTYAPQKVLNKYPKWQKKWVYTCPLKAQDVKINGFELAVKMANSEIKQFPDPWTVDFNPKPVWNYSQGLIAQSMLQLWKISHQEAYFNYAQNYANKFIDSTGVITGYKLEDYSLDLLNSGKFLFDLYETTKEDKYLKAVKQLRYQFSVQPRTLEGGFWHKQRYPHQMWLDGLYMGAPFYAQCAVEFNESASFDDIVNQFVVIHKHTYDTKTGLNYHGWDERKVQKWADPTTGCSPCFWGRAMGWYAMALVDVLDFIPQDHAGRSKLLEILNQVVVGIKKYQDPTTGLWYQVLDQGKREGNYLEASASSMFTYALLKASRKGYICDQYKETALKGYKGIVKYLIRKNTNGTISLTQCCSVAGLGGNPYRNGSYAYYIHEQVRDNDPKGVGPFILASLEFNAK